MLTGRLGSAIWAASLLLGTLVCHGEEARSKIWRPFFYPDDAPSGQEEVVAPPATGEPWVVPNVGMEFVWIGQLDCWVGKYEVTNGEYRKFKPRHDSRSVNTLSLNDDRQPVVYVNYDDAMAYAAWLTNREKRAGRLPAGYRYRLPTALEWTIFCQCGDKRNYPWGNDMPPTRGNYHGQEGVGLWGRIDGYADGFPVTCPVERSGENEWGLHGVGGNVWEGTVKSSKNLAFDAWRGGSWSIRIPYHMSSLCLYSFSASCRSNDIGFRLVLSR
jgi:formylglycine-generating enzyme required for sulfatase activity